MSKACFLYNPQSDRAALSGGNWLSGDVALANVQNDRYWRVARSASVDPADTQIRMNLLAPRSVRGFAAVLPNATTGALARLSAFDDDSYAVPSFTTGWLDGGELGATWRDDERSPIISADFGAEITARYWLLEIDDADNPAGHLDIGRAFLGGALSPSFNYGYDSNGLSFKNNALSATTLSGGALYWRRINPRLWNCAFQYLPEPELFGSVYEFLRFVGFDREIFVMPDPDDRAHAQARQFFATLTQMDALTQAVWGRGNFGFGVEERVAPAASADAGTVIPTDGWVWLDYAPEIIASEVVDVPTDAWAWADYPPDIVTGVTIAVPTDMWAWADFVPNVGGEVIQIPPDAWGWQDFAPTVSTGALIMVPTDQWAWADSPPQPMRGFGAGFGPGFG